MQFRELSSERKWNYGLEYFLNRIIIAVYSEADGKQENIRFQLTSR
jgi:hypothetical protein